MMMQFCHMLHDFFQSPRLAELDNEGHGFVWIINAILFLRVMPDWSVALFLLNVNYIAA